jgi:hypothetical protein
MGMKVSKLSTKFKLGASGIWEQHRKNFSVAPFHWGATRVAIQSAANNLVFLFPAHWISLPFITQTKPGLYQRIQALNTHLLVSFLNRRN